MEIIFDVSGSTLIAELFGEMDHHSADGLREKIDSALDNYGTENLVLNFSGVSFMDSSGIGVVLGRYRKLSGTGGKMAVAACSKTVRNILNMAGVFSVIDCYDTGEEAAAEFNRKEVSQWRGN